MRDPVITCTIKQLVFVAWQRHRNPSAREDNSDLDLDPSGLSGAEFEAWWGSLDLAAGFPSIQAACREGWIAAAKPPDFEAFEVWWQHDVIAAQPIMTDPANG